MDGFDYVICDVFTDRPLVGNQLAVFTDAIGIPERSLQPLAREFNLSETVFVYPPEVGGAARIRIFTPAAELPFAGHPVLGTAVVLATERGLAEVRLETGAGVVPVRFEGERGRAPFGRMVQPVPTVTQVKDAAATALLAVLGVNRSLLPVERYVNGPAHVYLTLEDEAAVARLRPDLGALAIAAREVGEPVVGVNCIAGRGHRWKTRMFAPVEGFEDPATGSAAGPLACHLLRHGLIDSGEQVEISQGAEIGRLSTLFARVVGSADAIERVEVGGSAVIVARGVFSRDAVL